MVHFLVFTSICQVLFYLPPVAVLAEFTISLVFIFTRHYCFYLLPAVAVAAFSNYLFFIFICLDLFFLQIVVVVAHLYFLFIHRFNLFTSQYFIHHKKNSSFYFISTIFIYFEFSPKFFVKCFSIYFL